jgi:hypothetical protein
LPTTPIAPGLIVPSPPASPPLHGLYDSARDLPTGGLDPKWEMGMNFMPENCFDVEAWSPECNVDGQQIAGAGILLADAPENPGEVHISPFTLFVPFECTMTGVLERDDRARVLRQVEAATSKGMEAQFWGNPLGLTSFSLKFAANVEVLGGGVPVKALRALSMIEKGLADCGPGSRGMIHSPSDVGTIWTSLHGVSEGNAPADGNLTTKARGDILVIGSGYDGTGPDGVANEVPPANSAWVFATGMVERRVGVPYVDEDDIAAVNRKTVYGKRTVSAAVDGCCVLAVLVDLT